MLCTIKMDAMGSLHIWEGDVNPTGYKYTWRVNGKDADVYIQEGSEGVQSVLECLTPQEKDQLDHGWAVTTKRIPSEYFPE